MNIKESFFTPSLGGRWREAFSLIAADKLFSAIYIAGTAVAIASAMVAVIVLNIKMSDIKPEVNRSRTLYPHIEYHSDNHNGSLFYIFSTIAIDSCFSKMKCVELVTGNHEGQQAIYNESYSEHINVVTKMCDPNFFRLYSFTFVEGRPFSEKEFRNGEHVCVITEDLAKRLYYKEKGGTFRMNNNTYRVVGVVKTVCSLMIASTADIYYPHTSAENFWVEQFNGKGGPLPTVSYCGDLSVEILLRKGYTRQDFIEEIEPIWKHYISQIRTQTGEEIDCKLLVNNHFLQQMNVWTDTPEEIIKAALYIPLTLMILIFLFLPAINLSGLVSNRMEARLPEMGIRKAFGAKRFTLLREVINENLVLTLCGGAVGWVLSWFFVNAFRNNEVFLTVLFNGSKPNPNAGMEFSMFFTPKLFLICFVCCAVLNLMAALIPAWRSLGKPIVESLSQKK